MRRREFLCSIAAALGLRPAAAIAQSLAKRPLVAVLLSSSATSSSRIASGFLEGMRVLGYAQDSDFEITSRYADGDETRTPDIVGELILLKPDVIVTPNHFVSITARSATTTVPIVCAALLDPVGLKLIAGYA